MISIFVPWKEFACYDEEKAAYIIEQGEYLLLLGNSSRNTKAVASVTAENEILVEQCGNLLHIQPCNQGKITFLSQADTFRKEGTMQDECKWQFVL